MADIHEQIKRILAEHPSTVWPHYLYAMHDGAPRETYGIGPNVTITPSRIEDEPARQRLLDLLQQLHGLEPHQFFYADEAFDYPSYSEGIRLRATQTTLGRELLLQRKRPDFPTADAIEQNWDGFVAAITPYLELMPSITHDAPGMRDVVSIPHHANVMLNLSRWVWDQGELVDSARAFFDFLQRHPGMLVGDEGQHLIRRNGDEPLLYSPSVFGPMIDGTSPLGARLVEHLDARDQAAQVALAGRPEWMLETPWDSGFDEVKASFVVDDPEVQPHIDAIFAGRNRSYYQHLTNNHQRGTPREEISGGRYETTQFLDAELNTTLGRTAAERLIQEAASPAAALLDMHGWRIAGGTVLAIPTATLQQTLDETALRQLHHARVLYPIILDDGEAGYAINGYGPQYAEAPEALELFERINAYSKAVYERVSSRLRDDIELVRDMPEILVTREAEEWTEGLPTGVPYVSHAFTSQLDDPLRDAFERLHDLKAVFWEEELPSMKDAPFGLTPEQLFIANHSHGIFCHGLPTEEQWKEHWGDLGWSARDWVKKYMDAPDTLAVDREAHIEHLKTGLPHHALASIASRRMLTEDLAAMDSLLPALAGAYDVEPLLDFLRDNHLLPEHTASSVRG